ncbi:hypothetical protein ACFL3T_00645 [Patescibacteria group bacterium]
MKYKERIYEAWQFTQSNKKMVMWYALVPAILTTLIGILYVGYQIMAFRTSELFNWQGQSFAYELITNILNFIQNNIEISVPLIIGAAVIGILFLLLPILADASMMQVVARRRNGQKTGLGEGMKFGMLRFLPLFEYSLLVKTFSFVSISAEAAFIIRNFGPDAFSNLMPVLIVVAIIALILHILFTFAEYYIVIDETGVMSGVVKSCTLVILNIQQTFMLVILMLIIAARILIQMILVIIIPAVIITGLAFYASINLPEYGLIILGGISVLFIIFTSYLAAVVHVFSVAVWTYTFLDFTEADLVSARDKVEA